MENELLTLIRRYADVFSENFPVFQYRMSDAELKKALKECLDKGKTYSELIGDTDDDTERTY